MADPARQGFSLVELLVALAVFSLAAMALLNLSGENTRSAARVEDRTLGGVVAENLAVEAAVTPDLAEGDHDRIVRAAMDHGIDALIVANTTISRPTLASHYAGEAGGLSGRPLKTLALDQLRRFRAASGGALALIAAGGVEDADDAWARIRAGASLLQLYSALVYGGPGLGKRIASGLASRLKQGGYATIADAVGTG